MKYPILTTLAAAALLTGCYRLPDDGGGNTGERFKLEFAPVRSVTVDSWGDPQPLSNRAGATGGTIPSEPPQPPSFPTTVRIEGSGSVETPWSNTGAAIAAQRGNISLSYGFAIDNGCKATAEQAQREGRSLQVEGFGTVAELAVAMAQVCYPGPISGGGSAGGSTGGSVGSGTVSSNALLAYPYPCPLPPQPVEPQRADDPSQPEYPTGCWCQPPQSSFYVRAEKIASCSLGGKVTEPPTPGPSPLPPVEPQPAPQPL